MLENRPADFKNLGGLSEGGTFCCR